MANSLLFDAILYLYALGLLFTFSDHYGTSGSGQRTGEWLLFFVWLLQTVYLAAHLVSRGWREAVTVTEIFFLLSWVMVTVTLVVNRYVQIRLLLFGVNVIGFAALALHFFSQPDVVPLRPGWEISDEVLFIHITLSVGSYAAFSVSAVWSGMYLFLHRRLKEKQWTSSLRRLPSLEKLERFALRAAAMGVPMLLMATTLGIVWLVLEGRSVYLTDWKVVSSLLILAAYCCYLLPSITRRMAGYRLAVWNVSAFAGVVLNFVLSNTLSQFHQWSWM